MYQVRTPKIRIKSKNDLAKRLSDAGCSKERALALINDVLKNLDKYWHDNKAESEPEKDKYVRSACGTPLGKLLKMIDKKVFAPYDTLLPPFIFGGISDSNHVKACQYLLGQKRRRLLLKADIARFYEHVTDEKTIHFLTEKAGCSKVAARLLTRLCCISVGPKNQPGDVKTVGRGLATSSRFAVWSNIDVFIELERLVRKRLKDFDPRLAVYVDDIGVSASRISKDKLESLYDEIDALFLGNGLPLNPEKKQIFSHEEGLRHLGLLLNRASLSLSGKTKSKKYRLKSAYAKAETPEERSTLKKRLNSIRSYEGYVVHYKPKTR